MILDGTKERQGDFVFTANDEGEYRFCFNNEMSTFAEKTVDFEIAVRAPFHPTTIPETSFFEALSPSQLQRWISNYNRQYDLNKDMSDTNAGNHQVENEVRAQLPSKQGAHPEQTTVLEESILKLSAQLSTISRNQKYFRTRENRNFSTVKSTEKRIFNFSIMEVTLMVVMAGLQVFIVRFFFQGARKGKMLACQDPRTREANQCHRLRMSETLCNSTLCSGAIGIRWEKKGSCACTWPAWAALGRAIVYHHSGISGYGVQTRFVNEISFCCCSCLIYFSRQLASLTWQPTPPPATRKVRSAVYRVHSTLTLYTSLIA